MTMKEDLTHKEMHEKADFEVNDFSRSVRRLNNLANALNAKNYLEIGVESGLTFFQVACEKKTGVDPCFLFDTEVFTENESISFFSGPSDQFFRAVDSSTVYDLIFIDGLHTYEQTYRDILNSLRHAHPETVILVDDTVPCDAFSACRDQSECVALRRELSGTDDIRWHGDTYKVLPLLSVFNPELALATITDCGNPQTLLWRPKKPLMEDSIRMTQAMWALQNLAAADYLWMLENFSLFNPVSENEALDQVLTSLNLK